MQIFSEKTLARKHFERHQNLTLIFAGILIGIGGGYGAVAFRYLINFFQSLFYEGAFSFELLNDERVLDMLQSATRLHLIIIPIVGALIIGPVIYFWAREAKGHGVPEVMESVNLKGGIIRKRIVFIKALASAICIASGGSVGREGPIVQIGSSWGSTFGQILKVKKEDIRIMIGCGAAAGIAATFNAPIAGAFFAFEIILCNFQLKTITPIMISSVLSTVVSHHYLGNTPSFIVPIYTMVSFYEIPLYIVLGIISSIVGLAFIKSLYGLEDFIDALRFPEYLKPCLGAFALGIIGLFCVRVYGVGYGTINLALRGDLLVKELALLLVLKCLATSLTLGSGGSGGVFAPSLFMGAMVGGIFGHALNYLFPGITAGPGAYALVGMGCVVAATTHAPICAIVILFEMTREYKLILPLMLGCVISVTLTRHLKRESIYTMKLIRRGVTVNESAETKVLRSIQVKEMMHTKYEIIPENMTMDEFIQFVPKSGHLTFPVVKKNSQLFGLISLPDFQDYVATEMKRHVIVKELANPRCITLTPEHSLLDALKIVATQKMEQIPVVMKDEPRHLVGMLSRRDMLKTYYKLLSQTSTEEELLEVSPKDGSENRLMENLVIEKLQGRTKEEAIAELISLMKDNGLLHERSSKELKKRILEREDLASTVLAKGIAAPHARLEELDRVVFAFGHSEQGLEFEGADPVHSLLLFLSPMSPPKIHLNFICQLGNLLKGEGVVEKLNSSGDKQSILKILGS